MSAAASWRVKNPNAQAAAREVMRGARRAPSSWLRVADIAHQPTVDNIACAGHVARFVARVDLRSLPLLERKRHLRDSFEDTDTRARSRKLGNGYSSR
jgi:hypothetical protein